MTKKNILGLPPLNPNYGFGMDSSGINPENNKLAKRDLQEINRDSIKRKVIVDAIASNDENAVQRVMKMDQNGFVTCYNSVQFIFEMNEESEGTDYHEFSTALTERMAQLMVHHTFGFLDVGAMRIAYEVNRPPQPVEEPKGFLGKFLG